MSRLFGSVRSRATLGATLVVAVALVAAGTALLLSLRANLTSEAGTRAERSAQAVASELAARTPLDKLSGLDAEDTPCRSPTRTASCSRPRRTWSGSPGPAPPR